MRLVVTGASGFIGRNFLVRAPRSWEIAAVYNRATWLPDFVRSQALTHVRPHQCDLTDPDAVRHLGLAIGWDADATLYLAANGDPSRSVDEPLWDLQSNTAAVINFLEHCRTPHLVYLSSGAVYDGLTGPVSPASAVNPTLPYAISKLASEGYIRFAAERRGNPVSYAIVRFFGAYGPYEPPRKITTRWLLSLREGRREFTLRGDGRNLIDLMYVDDAVDGLLRLLESPGMRVTVDFASGDPKTIDEVGLAMARALGVEVALRHEGETAEYIRFHTVDQTLGERFGIAPKTTFDTGMQRLAAFYEADATQRTRS